MRRELEQLKEENSRLRSLAQTDSLTGLLNHGTVADQANLLLQKKSTGVMLIIDIDRFRIINDQYGHLVGDQLLKDLGAILENLFRKEGVAGRVGGDEFVVFIPNPKAIEVISAQAEQLQQWIYQASRQEGLAGGMRVSIGAEVSRAGDTYSELFQRADAALLTAKRTGAFPLYLYQAGDMPFRRLKPAEDKKAYGDTDMEQIRRQLREDTLPPGAYCQDYESFQRIYRFVERGLQRRIQDVHLILMTLTDMEGNFVQLERREALMKQLYDSIRLSLRSGDVFTQYSSCQFLIMVPGASYENTRMIAGRITNVFSSDERVPDDVRLRHEINPLRPAGQDAAQM